MCQGRFHQLFPQLRRKRPCLRKNKENDRLPAVMRICYLPRENAGTVLSSCFGHTTGAIGTVLGAFRQSEASGLSIWRKPTQPASARSKAVDSTAAHRFQTGRCDGDAKLVPLGTAFFRFPTSPTGSTTMVIFVLSFLKERMITQGLCSGLSPG